MRILLCCHHCKRRYDASQIRIGARVRCHCGRVMEVQQPKSRESAIVRCSGCGAPREQDSPACTFCSADFTLHEQDLETACPNCLTRVSDRARYCNHCGDRLSAETVAGEIGPWSCPLCGLQAKLRSRQLGKQRVNVGECQRCAGLWLGHDSFEQLRDRAVKAAAHLENLSTEPPKPAQLLPQSGPAHRPCVQCGNLMIRQQYARGSGVVIDLCRAHGIWFDPQELHQILDWIGRGGHLQKWESLTYQEQQPKPTTERAIENALDDAFLSMVSNLSRRILN